MAIELPKESATSSRAKCIVYKQNQQHDFGRSKGEFGFLHLLFIQNVPRSGPSNAMKPNTIINEAIYGTDRDGQEKWFCWRMAVGCPGHLAALVYENQSGKQFETTSAPGRIPLEARAVLVLPSWLQYREKQRFFGVQTRPLTRSSRGREYQELSKGAIRSAAEMRQDGEFLTNPFHKDAPGIMEEIAEGYDKEKVAAVQDVLVSGQDLSQWRAPLRAYHLLPAIVECRSCRARSRIPSLRGVKQVLSGRLQS